MKFDYQSESSVMGNLASLLGCGPLRIIDCGANVGGFTSGLAREVEKICIDNSSNFSMHSFLFEPNSSLNDSIHGNLSSSVLFRDKMENEHVGGLSYQIFNKALGPKTGSSSFNFLDDHTGSSFLDVEDDLKIISPNYSVKETSTVEVITLDEFLTVNGYVDFLKIDAQGFDLEVLKGGVNSLRNQEIGLVMIEFTVAKQYVNQYSLGDLFQFMNSFDYRLHSFLRLIHTSKGYLYFGDVLFCSPKQWIQRGFL